MKKCELCESRANTYCESDEASLCWSCDANVHAGNFIVEKHSRTLLCHICQSPTPWTATGSNLNLGPTLSVCHFCINPHQNAASRQNSPSSRDDDEDEENQVVPLSPPPVSSSSRSEEESCGGGGCTGKEYISRPQVATLEISPPPPFPFSVVIRSNFK